MPIFFHYCSDIFLSHLCLFFFFLIFLLTFNIIKPIQIPSLNKIYLLCCIEKYRKERYLLFQSFNGRFNKWLLLPTAITDVAGAYNFHLIQDEIEFLRVTVSLIGLFDELNSWCVINFL